MSAREMLLEQANTRLEYQRDRFRRALEKIAEGCWDSTYCTLLARDTLSDGNQASPEVSASTVGAQRDHSDATSLSAPLPDGEGTQLTNDHNGTGLTEGVAVSGLVPPPKLPHDERPAIRDRVMWAGTGWCAHTHSHDNSKAALSAADEALSILNERIESKLTPALNTGTAMDMLILVAEALREIRAELEAT